MDDLSRPPTGRVPKWVRDVAAGRGGGIPPGWPTAAAAAAQPPERAGATARRSPATGSLLLVVLLSAVGLGGSWFADHPAFGGLEAGSEQLPPAVDRDYPAPGFEEAPAALGTPPAATPGDGPYAFLSERTDAAGVTTPVTWSPCRPIHYVTDLTGAPENFALHVRTTVAEVSAATGLRFVDDGLTVEAADIDRAPFLPALYGDRWAPVLVRFADETDVANLTGGVGGVANPLLFTDPTTGRTHVVTGAVYIDTEVLGMGTSAGGVPVYVHVLRHELGHLVGLDHVDDPAQAMHPSSSGGMTAFQPGDLAGLALLGRGPCAPGL